MLLFYNPDLLALVQLLYILLSILMQCLLLPSALYMLELVNACTIPEKLVFALHLHFTAYFEGELHLRGRFIPGGVTFMSVL